MAKASARPVSTSSRESSWSLPSTMSMSRLLSRLYLRITCALVVPEVLATFFLARSA